MKIFIIGASGHGKVCLDAIESTGKHEVLGYIDDNPSKHGTTFYGLPVVGAVDDLLGKLKGKVKGVFIAIGNNMVRNTLFDKLTKHYTMVNAIHSETVVSESVVLGQGVLIMAGAIVNADTQIGDGVIINTGATVDHDCSIGKFAFIAPGANLSGTIQINDRTLIGTGAIIIPNISIGKDVVVGAGAVVVKDLPDNCTAYGVPAKIK
ncbi:MAG: acetyltransferase [Candidatus Heimdallarchaeota archaeon]